MPMQDVKKTDMKSETNVKRVRRRNRWLPLYIAVVLVLTAGVGVALSTTVFFNVENRADTYAFAKTLFNAIVDASGPEVAVGSYWDPVTRTREIAATGSYWGDAEKLSYDQRNS